MKGKIASLALAIAAAGCTAGTSEPDEMGFVLLDREARAAGQLSHGTWRGAPLLPVALDVTEPVAYASTAGRVVLNPRAGALAYVHGPGGSVEWLRVGEDVGADRLRVIGTREAAADLATRVAGRVEASGDGAWTIIAPDLLERASFLDVPEGVVEVSPERSFGGLRLAPGASIALPGALPRDDEKGARQAALIGVYTSGSTAWILDADGGFSVEDACSGEAIDRGRYRLDEDRVVLESDASARVLTWEGGALRDAAGLRLAPVLPPQEPSVAIGGEP